MTKYTTDSSRRSRALIATTPAYGARQVFRPWLLVLTVMILATSRGSAQDGTYLKLLLTGDSAPNFVGKTFGGGNLVLNNAGAVAFTTSTDHGESGILKWKIGVLTAIATTHDIAPGLGTAFTNIFSPAIDDAGDGVVFYGFTDSVSNNGLFGNSGSGLVAVVTSNTPNPNFPGNFVGFTDSPTISSSSVIFVAVASGNSSAVGIYNGNISGTTPVLLVSTLDAVPGLPPSAPQGNFLTFGAPSQNNYNANFCAFVGSSAGATGIFLATPLVKMATIYDQAPGLGGNFGPFGTPHQAVSGLGIFTAFHGTGGSFSGEAIYVEEGGVINAIATNNNMVAPGLNSNFAGFGDPAIGGSGRVAFIATAFNNKSAVYRGRGAFTVTPVALQDAAAPGLGGPFASFQSPTINAAGAVAFVGQTSGGLQGIYLGDGTDLLTIAYQGQSLQGSTISMSTGPSFVGGPDPGGRTGLNNQGQLAFSAFLTNGKNGAFLFTPNLYYRRTVSGAWDNSDNWTIGQPPGLAHPVFITPPLALTVTGPAAATSIYSLLLNGSGTGVAQLALQPTGPISTTNGLTIGPLGLLTGPGTINGSVTINAAGGATANSGILTFNGITINQGTLRMTGGATLSIPAPFQNMGVIDVITGNFNPQLGFTNTGTILDSSLVKVKQLTKNGAGVTVTIDGYTGHTYQLQRSGSLSSDSFTNVGPPVDGTTGQPIQFADIFGASEGFYRVQVF